MSPLERLTSVLGLTRGDLRVALFLSATALAGFVYTEFIEKPADFQQRTDMAALLVAADSISSAAESVGFASLGDGITPQWRPLTPEEVLEEGTDGEGRTELTLEDVAPIDINTAPPEILELLPGIGEKTAKKIVAARPFANVPDLIRVHGIGPKKLAKLQPYIVVRGNAEEKGVAEIVEEETSPGPDSSEDSLMSILPDSLKKSDTTGLESLAP